ncbi:MAG: hypothetical protein ACTHNG_04320 [Ginsengibacter sp.]
MKNIFKLFVVALSFLMILEGCSSTKNPSSAQHNRGVNNRHFAGY